MMISEGAEGEAPVVLVGVEVGVEVEVGGEMRVEVMEEEEVEADRMEGNSSGRILIGKGNATLQYV